MKTLFKRLLLWLIQRLSTDKAQPLLEFLHAAILRGMNYGQGGNPEQSGEDFFVKSVVATWFRESDTKTAFDVGANIGDYSLLLARHLPKESTIYSFEPQAVAYDSLTKRFGQDAKNNIKLFQLGFSDKPGTAKLYTNKHGSGLTSLYQRRLAHFDIEMNLSEEIRMESIDEFCLQHGISRIDFLKLDIEGHEIKALQGAERMIEEHRIDIIQWEFGGCNIDSRTFIQDFYYMLTKHYVICRLLRAGLYPIEGYRETYEVFTTTNWCAISKRLLALDPFKRHVLHPNPGLRRLVDHSGFTGIFQ